MVDDTNLNEATGSLNDVANQVELLKKASEDFTLTANNYIDVAKKLANIPGWDGASAEQMQKGLSAGVTGTQELASELIGTGKSGQQSMEKIDDAAKKSASMIEWFGKKFASTLDKAFAKAKTLSKELLQGADAAGGFLAVKGYKEFISKVDGASGVITDIQKPLLETRRLAIQTGLGFGQSFAKASSDLELFHAAMGKTQETTNSTREEVVKVQNSLKEAFSPEAMIKNLDSLVGANKKFESSVNLTNVALLVAKAKGMSQAETAQMMATAHLELGESAESVPKIFAQIADAAEDSGLQYSAVSKHIVELILEQDPFAH
ncbi:MAG TPA: hypothetical protein ENI23_17825, partial [bacterium]|nr:hypothetical protein [bacterium]